LTAVYLDTSAVLKLVIDEPEAQLLRGFLRGDNPRAIPLSLVSSELTVTEALRAGRRLSEDAVGRVEQLLASLYLIRLTGSMFHRVGKLLPFHLRSLDALHLQAALELGEASMGIVTYDARLAEAARGAGVTVFTPRADSP
jgi:uncharacterized protein